MVAWRPCLDWIEMDIGPLTQSIEARQLRGFGKERFARAIQHCDREKTGELDINMSRVAEMYSAWLESYLSRP